MKPSNNPKVPCEYHPDLFCASIGVFFTANLMRVFGFVVIPIVLGIIGAIGLYASVRRIKP